MKKLNNFGLLILVIVLHACSKLEIIDRYENGDIKEECQFKNGQKNGICRGYFPDGSLEYIVKFKNDTLNGESLFFHKNGYLHWKVNFDMGVKNGNIKYYDERGKVFQESNFENNQLHGISLNYYPSGKLKSKMTYMNGMLDGDFFSYYEEGRVSAEAFYEDDQLIDFVSYNSEGDVTDHMIKYEIEEVKGELKIKVLNKYFNVVGVSMGIEDVEGTIMTIEEDFSKDETFTFLVPQKYREKEKLYFRIFEMDSMVENPDKGIVRSKIEFEYGLKYKD